MSRNLLLQNRPNSYFLWQFWNHIYVIYVLQNVRRFSLFTDVLFFNIFSFLKCLIYMLIVILLHFIESFLLLKTLSKNFRLFATTIRVTKAFCRHPQHIFMILAMFQVFRNFIFRKFFHKSFWQCLTLQNYWCCLELLELFHILEYCPASCKIPSLFKGSRCCVCQWTGFWNSELTSFSNSFIFF
jgi:hypothetical protein